MAFSVTNFEGVLDGITVRELNQKIDYKKKTLAERMEVVRSIVGGTDFFSEYFSEYFKGSINTSDPLSSNVNVCRTLEKLANYILNSEEVKKEEDLEKIKYIFHTDEKYFKKKLDREQSPANIGNANSHDHEQNVIHFLKKEEENSKKLKTQVITKSDLKREGMLGEVLRDYHLLLETVTENLVSKNKKHNRYLLTKIKGEVTNDMLYTKDTLLGTFGYQLQNDSESTVYDFDVFDFTNRIHLVGKTIRDSKDRTMQVKGLLYFKPQLTPDNDFSLVLLDLQRTIEQAGLTYEELEVLRLTREGLTQELVAVEMKTYQKKVSRLFNSLVDKIIAVGNKYDRQEEN